MTEETSYDRWPVALLATTVCSPVIPVLAFSAFDLLSGTETGEWLRRVKENLPALALLSLLFGIVPSFVGSILFSGVACRIPSQAWFPIWMTLGATIGGTIGAVWLVVLVLSSRGDVTFETFAGGSAWGAIAGAGGALIFKSILFARMPRWGRKTQ